MCRLDSSGMRARFLRSPWLLAGLLAAALASALGHVLATQVLELSYSLNLWLWVLGPAAGGLGVGLAGLLGTRRVVSSPPLVVLRQG